MLAREGDPETILPEIIKIDDLSSIFAGGSRFAALSN